jgi:hypothetical protein
MATQRGFVKRIEVGRAGLVRVTLVHSDASTGDYVLRDLDADPERFNERLSKLAILRDAMDRAEPVFIEHSATDQGQEIDTVARLSRDDLDPAVNVVSLSGFVLDVMVHARNQAVGDEEEHDRADVVLLLSDFSRPTLTLDLQAPERAVAAAQLDLLCQARTAGGLARVITRTTKGDFASEGEIISVAIDDESALSDDGREPPVEEHGFVETLSLIPITTTGGTPFTSNMAHIRFTTAPAFSGPGNTVGLVAFTPVTIDLLVFKGSPAYALFEAGLRDCLRMRVSLATFAPPDDSGRDTPPGTTVPRSARGRSSEPVGRAAAAEPTDVALVLAAELLAPLASASRGVWIRISRRSLDHGPEGDSCTPGVPSSDLSPQSLRDLRIPYPAEWRGLGCFNHGVYRFQFLLETEFTVCVDGTELCLHDADDGSERFAHACLGGEHEIVVKLEGWRCDYTFTMDIYRLR